jgi:hypothetical protein
VNPFSSTNSTFAELGSISLCITIFRLCCDFLLHPNNYWEYGANVLHAYQCQLGRNYQSVGRKIHLAPKELQLPRCSPDGYIYVQHPK